LVRAALITPAYLSVAWTLMVSYQLFTQTAVETVVGSIKTILPDLGILLLSRIDMVVFIYAFAWVFVLSSAIPSILLGKGRGVIIQFIVCLTLTLSAFVVLDVLNVYAHFDLAGSLTSYVGWFTNPIFAVFYLSLPYVFMLALDLRARKKHKAENQVITTSMGSYIQEDTSKDTQLNQKLTNT